jgi:two-component system, OmpR family, sensor histidine kinase KdpD
MRRALTKRRDLSSHAAALGASAALVGAVTGAIFAARSFAPVLSLGVLYLLAVVAVAVLFGLAYAVVVSVASMLAFNFFFLPPVHTFALRDSANWFALGVYLVTGVVVSELAARSRRRAADASQRELEAKLLASVAATLLEADRVQSRLKDVAGQLADALALSQARIELESLRRPDPGEAAADLRFGERHVGRLFFPAARSLPQFAEARLLPAVASILAVAVERDRLSRAAVEAETLRRSDAIKTAVLRAVSHDLRSPLTAIRAAGEGLRRADLQLEEEDRAELAETITTEAARLERLVTNLIDLSRLEAGAARPRPELWTADDLVGRALETLGAAAERVDVRLPDEPVAAVVDGAQAERVLVNLLENAVKFSSATDPIEVSVTGAENELVIRVRDHGPGVPPARAARIFDPFESSAPGAGMGLGLAIATGFAQANGGRVWFEPADGGGAVFALALPAAEVPAEVRS